jgi:hypothetical protein
MSKHSAAPRTGQIEAVYHIFLYLTKHDKSYIVFDASSPILDLTNQQVDTDWKPFYGDLKEEDLQHLPEPLDQVVNISCFVDANHAGDVVTQQLPTGTLIFVQNAPILWYSKKQNTVELSAFRSELVALRIAKDLLVVLWIS